MPTKTQYPEGFSHEELQRLRTAMQAAGREVPDASLRSIGWWRDWGCWRVQLPVACKQKLQYFSVRNLGGLESALIEAQLYRDAEYKKVGAEIHSRKRVKDSHFETFGVLVAFDERRNRSNAHGCWMETVNGVCKQVKVQRTIANGLRTEAEAVAEVKELMLAGIARENQRLKDNNHY